MHVSLQTAPPPKLPCNISVHLLTGTVWICLITVPTTRLTSASTIGILRPKPYKSNKGSALASQTLKYQANPSNTFSFRILFFVRQVRKMYTPARPRAWRNTAETSIPREKKKHITRRGSNIDACRERTTSTTYDYNRLHVIKRREGMQLHTSSFLHIILPFCYTRVLRFLVLRKDEEKVDIQTTQTIPTNK